MAGQSVGASAPQMPPAPPSNPFQTPRKHGRNLRDKVANLWRRLADRVRRNPAIWWPVILVSALAVFGAALGSIDTSTTSTADTVVPKGSGTTTPTADGTINDLIVHSIVAIVAYENGEPCQQGSGSIVGDSRHVLTNQHVIASDEECTVDEIRVQTMKNSGDLPRDMFIGKVLASDEDIDLAILSIEPINANFPTLRPLEISSSNSVGQDLVVVGFPAVGGDSVTVSKGIISGFAFEYGVQWIKTDAAISGGNSGGAALDTKNRLIGIPTMLSQSSDGRGTDCRKAADTNGDGVIDDEDTCVGVGGTFALLATSETAVRFAKTIGLDISRPIAPSPTTTSPKR
jgi:S1-C subfamily serine protease